MKVHKLEIYVLEPNNDSDLEQVRDEIGNGLENYVVHFAKCETKESEEWSDEHPLNYNETDATKYFDKLK